MAYVSRPPSGFFGGYDVGYYTPDGNWQSHSAGLSQSAADELVNTLNGRCSSPLPSALRQIACYKPKARWPETAEHLAGRGARVCAWALRRM